MTNLTLYTNPMSRGRIARWMMEEVGEPYNVEILPYGAAMKTPAYLAINPMGKVPALRHGDAIITESAAICTYMAMAFPKAGLAPRTGEMANFFRWMYFAAGPLEAAVANHVLKVDIPEDRRGMIGYGSYEKMVDTLEHAVSRHPYITGERFTAADVYVGAQIGWGLGFGTLPAREALVTYWETLEKRPAAQRANALDDASVASAS